MTRLSDILLKNRQEQIKNDLLVKPLFYRIGDLKQKENLEQLLLTPGIIVCDFLFDQVKQLIKIKFPS